MHRIVQPSEMRINQRGNEHVVYDTSVSLKLHSTYQPFQHRFDLLQWRPPLRIVVSAPQAQLNQAIHHCAVPSNLVVQQEVVGRLTRPATGTHVALQPVRQGFHHLAAGECVARTHDGRPVNQGKRSSGVERIYGVGSAGVWKATDCNSVASA